MKLLMKRTSIALLSSAGALALLVAATVSVTPAYAVMVDPEDCTTGCPGPEGPDVSNPGPETPEPESGSEGGARSDPAPDSEPDASSETSTL